MPDLVHFETRGAIGVITVDNPPVNALSVGVPQGIIDGVRAGLADDKVTAMVLRGAGRGFIAGADIKEFGNPPPPGNANIFDAIEACETATKPIIAAVHGNALGGGLEVAFGCHYRCGVAGSRYGFPEVLIGILPGAYGSQKLPRVVGVEAALPLLVSGAAVPVDKAAAMGIIDEVIEGDLLTGAIAFAERIVAEGRPLRRIRDETAAPPAEGFFEAFEKSIAKRARGYLAPYKIIECAKAAVTLPYEEGIKRERELVTDCFESDQSKGLIHMFFAERAANKIPDVPRDTPIKAIDKAAVIGAGTMGGGIAMNFANAGIPVTMVEVGQEALDRGVATITKNYANTVAKGRLSQDDMDARLALIAPTLDFEAIAGADIVIEAVFEEMDIKKEVFTRLDKVMNADAILATNTSTLDVDAIADVTARPESVIGTHFFSPANVMRLLEVVRGAKTAKPVIATTMALAKTINKVPVLVGVCDGFVGNRMLARYSRQALQMIVEGALPQQVDKALYDHGLAMGPFAMGDLAGLDVGWRIRKRRRAESAEIPDDSPIEDQVCELGRFGQKTGAGWYKYAAGDRTPIPDPEVEAMIVKYSEQRQITRREISEQEIIERCMYQLVNEGAKILDEGMALRASDIDVIYASGYGYPRYRGGPMFYADQVGLDKVYAAVRRYQERLGDDWTPAPLLKRLAEEGRKFSDL
ncbi:MAG: 3-hydroxyacyl-CoA dehydrogenase NAD-binding domain-containing protein [Alphaproteobacteria bacterium]|jgi:3-hydroxyacyl-CoA dehydrogenase|nr:3-hydroxyacyl-CoA dehydrogenase NAD-binding domain-containing protein [Alphaproteobacteria bacterium]